MSFQDADRTFVRDAARDFDAGDRFLPRGVALVGGRDHNGKGLMNYGKYWMRATPATVALASRVAERTIFHNAWDQAVWNEEINRAAGKAFGACLGDTGSKQNRAVHKMKDTKLATQRKPPVSAAAPAGARAPAKFLSLGVAPATAAEAKAALKLGVMLAAAWRRVLLLPRYWARGDLGPLLQRWPVTVEYEDFAHFVFAKGTYENHALLMPPAKYGDATAWG